MHNKHKDNTHAATYPHNGPHVGSAKGSRGSGLTGSTYYALYIMCASATV